MKKEMRKLKFAQASVFIIVAIVILSAIILGIFLSKKNSGFERQFSSDPQVQAQFDRISNSISDCMDYTSIDAIDWIGFQGGYYNKPKESFDLGWAFIPYYYKEGQFLMPDNSEIQNQLSFYVDDNLNSCLNEINESGFSINYNKPKTTSVISEQDVLFSIDMPISIQKDSKTVKIELISNLIRIDSKLYEMLEIAKYITDSHKQDPDNICVNCVADMARERSLYVDMIDFVDNTTIMVVISSNQTEISPIGFEFLNKYKDKGIVSPTVPN